MKYKFFDVRGTEDIGGDRCMDLRKREDLCVVQDLSWRRLRQGSPFILTSCYPRQRRGVLLNNQKKFHCSIIFLATSRLTGFLQSNVLLLMDLARIYMYYLCTPRRYCLLLACKRDEFRCIWLEKYDLYFPIG